MQKNYSEDGRVTKLQVHISLIDFNRLGQFRIANTTTMPILERDLTSLKRKMDVTLQIRVFHFLNFFFDHLYN